VTTSTSPTDVGCTCRATGTCQTCRHFARISAEAFARTALRRAQQRALDLVDRIDAVERRVAMVEQRLARRRRG
jgi:hypothetical protein